MFLQLHRWPQFPAQLEPCGLALILVELPPATAKAEARQSARRVLRTILNKLLPAHTLLESPSGPQVAGLKISLSYAADKILIGLSSEDELGVDIVKIEHIEEIEGVARLYLAESDCLSILEEPPELRDARFARAWSQMEACCKSLKLPLAEISDARARSFSRCHQPDCEQIDGFCISVAVSCPPP